MKKIFTPEQVATIRTLAHQRVPYHIIADSFPNATQTAIYNAARGNTYSDITDPPPVAMRREPKKANTYDDGRSRCTRCTILSKIPLCKWCQEELQTPALDKNSTSELT